MVHAAVFTHGSVTRTFTVRHNLGFESLVTSYMLNWSREFGLQMHFKVSKNKIILFEREKKEEERKILGELMLFIYEESP